MKYKTLQTPPFDSQMDQDINYPFGQECNLKYMRALFNPDYAIWFQPPPPFARTNTRVWWKFVLSFNRPSLRCSEKKTTTTTCTYVNGAEAAQLYAAPVCQPYQSYRVGQGERQIQLGLLWVWDARQLKQERRRDRNSGSFGRSSSQPVWLREPAGGSGINWHPEAGWFFWFSTDQGGGRRYPHIRGRRRPLASSFASLPLFFFVFFFPAMCSVTFLGRHSDGAGVDSLLVARSRKRHPCFVSTTDNHNRLRRSTVHHGNDQLWTSAPRHGIQPLGLLAFFCSAFNSRIHIYLGNFLRSFSYLLLNMIWAIANTVHSGYLCH